jgi:hypothetical protein
MKIYFAGSIRGGRQDQGLYEQIITLLAKYGSVLTEHVSDKNLTVSGENLMSDFIYRRDMDWLKESDILVAEVTQPSLGVGYEIAQAEIMGKKMLCIHRNGDRLSAMIGGNRNLVRKSYVNVSDLDDIFEDFFTTK